MANQAVVSLIEFGAGDPGSFTVSAQANYYKEDGTTTFANLAFVLPIGIDSAGVNSLFINEVVAAAPEGFEVTSPEILIPVYTSGSQPGLIE